MITFDPGNGLPATRHHAMLILSVLWFGTIHQESAMSPQLVTEFTTQFAAMAAVDKLLSYGLGREHVVVQVNGSVGKSAAGATTSTTVISHVGAHDHRENGEPSVSSYPDDLPHPAQFGQAQVTVELEGGLSPDDVRFILELAGAQSIRRVDEKFVREDPRVWPVGRHGNSTDVERAVEASRGGESMRSPWRK
jgi:hypothetical protein